MNITLFNNKPQMDLSDFANSSSPYTVTRHIEGVRNVKRYTCCEEPYIDLNFRWSPIASTLVCNLMRLSIKVCFEAPVSCKRRPCGAAAVPPPRGGRRHPRPPPHHHRWRRLLCQKRSQLERWQLQTCLTKFHWIEQHPTHLTRGVHKNSQTTFLSQKSNHKICFQAFLLLHQYPFYSTDLFGDIPLRKRCWGWANCELQRCFCANGELQRWFGLRPTITQPYFRLVGYYKFELEYL